MEILRQKFSVSSEAAATFKDMKLNDYITLLFDADGNPTARTGKILAATPQKRFGEVSDLIGTLLWLASDDASGFVTGVIVPVDGGFNAYSGV